MSTEGTDSGYLSNWHPCDHTHSHGTIQHASSKDWVIVNPDVTSSDLSDPWPTEGRGCEEHGQHCDIPEEFATSFDCQHTKTSITTGTIYASPDRSGNRTSVNAKRRGSQATAYKDSLDLFQELQHARANIQYALRRGANCWKDAAESSSRYSDILKAHEVLESILKRMTGCECPSGIAGNYAHASNLVTLLQDTDAMSDTSDTSSKAPSVLEKFFELAGEEFVVDERINELDAERADAMAMSQKKDSYDHTMPQLSLENEEQYRQRRQDLIDARMIARHQLQLQRKICLSEGINPERYRYRRISVADCKRFSGREILQKSGFDTITEWLQQSGSS